MSISESGYALKKTALLITKMSASGDAMQNGCGCSGAPRRCGSPVEISQPQAEKHRPSREARPPPTVDNVLTQ